MKFIEPLSGQGLLKNRQGKVVLWQMPNVFLWGWIACRFLDLVIKQPTISLWFSVIGTALIGAWAVLEITAGANYFRRMLGLIILGFVIVGLVR